MPRQAHIDLCGVGSAKTYDPAVLHHIIVRGIYRRKIFCDDADCGDSLDRLGGILSDIKTHCNTWVVWNGLRIVS